MRHAVRRCVAHTLFFSVEGIISFTPCAIRYGVLCFGLFIHGDHVRTAASCGIETDPVEPSFLKSRRTLGECSENITTEGPLFPLFGGYWKYPQR